MTIISVAVSHPPINSKLNWKFLLSSQFSFGVLRHQIRNTIDEILDVLDPEWNMNYNPINALHFKFDIHVVITRPSPKINIHEDFTALIDFLIASDSLTLSIEMNERKRIHIDPLTYSLSH